MRSSAVAVGDNATAKQYNDVRSDAFASAHLLPHEQATPDLTLKVESGIFFFGNTKVVYAGGNSPSFTAPTTNPRIDLLTMDDTGTLARVVGTEAASPSIPAYPNNKLVLCEVFNRVGQTTIRDVDTAGQGYIQRDSRPFIHKGEVENHSDVTGSRVLDTVYQNTSGRWMLICITCSLANSDSGGSSGSVTFQIGSASPPAIQAAKVRLAGGGNPATANNADMSATFLVPPDWYYRAVSATAAGGSVSILAWFESEMAF